MLLELRVLLEKKVPQVLLVQWVMMVKMVHKVLLVSKATKERVVMMAVQV